MKPKIALILSVTLIALVVLLQNTQVVAVRVLFWRVAMSQILLILLVLLVGFALGFGASRVYGRRRRRARQRA